MQKLVVISSVVLLISATGFSQSTATVPDQIKAQASFFPLQDVRLLQSPFKQAMEKDAAYLLSLEPDRFLHRFRLNAGLQPKAAIYGGWESQGISGHSLGHYLSACALMYAASGDKRFKEKTDYIIDELGLCQDARKTGYVGGMPREDSVFNEVAAGDIRSQGFDLNGGWVPWYTLHKMLAGLVDVYLQTGNKKALQILTRFADWTDNKFKNLNEAQFQKMLDCEQGGMNEVLAELYALTGNKKYLSLSYRFNHKKILDPLSESHDILPGRHANTQIPKIIGTARQYELTGNLKEKRTADFFWNQVTRHHSYVIGGNSNFEHFNKPDELTNYLSSNTTETCNSYNMLKLTRHLFALEPTASYMDYYERTLYNHILASINPDDGMTCYYVPLVSGGIKTYGTPTESFWCCTGTGMENHVKYGESIYAKGADDSLYINLFIPSALNWKEKNLNVVMETNFPESGNITIKFSGKAKSSTFPVKIRYPEWSNHLAANINGSPVKINQSPGNYFTITRTWKPGDKITISMPMHLYEEPMPDNNNRVALLFGPLVLSGELGNEKIQTKDIPVIVSDISSLTSLVKPAVNQKMVFQTESTSTGKPISMIPFYKMHHQHYIVYWDKFSMAAWNEKKKEYEAEARRQEEIKARTLDDIRIGEMQPERDHNLKSEKSNTGEAFDRKWRDSHDGGWFSFTMETKGHSNLELLCTYWGGDGGNREFDILVNDVKIATQKLTAEKPNSFIEKYYPIPADLLGAKQQITIRIQAHTGKMAGGLFGCSLIKSQ